MTKQARFLALLSLFMIFASVSYATNQSTTEPTYLPLVYSKTDNNHLPVNATIERIFPDPAQLLSGGYITALAHGADGKIYIARRAGEIERYDPQTSGFESLFTVPNSDISGIHLGLLGMAVSDHTNNDIEIYVSYSTPTKEAIISKFNLSGTTEEILLTIDPLHTDPDRDGVQTHHVPPIRYTRSSTGDPYLILLNGDGDMQNVPAMLPQEPCSIWGKILAIPTSVRNLKPTGQYTSDPRGLEYQAPYTNPNICDDDRYVPLMRGVRHPWGSQIITHHSGKPYLIFGDVGHDQSTWGSFVPNSRKMAFEEINMIPLDLENPTDFNGAWPLYEGAETDARSEKYGGEVAGVRLEPEIALSHEVEPLLPNLYRSITGGSIVHLDGYDYYVFGDYIQNEIYAAPMYQTQSGYLGLGAPTTILGKTDLIDLAEWGESPIFPVEFLPSDEEGVIYVAFRGIYRIELRN